MRDQTRILMVDDEPNVLAGYRRTLARKYDFSVAEGGPQGVQKLLNEGPYAVVISDMRMPGMNGVEFLQEARRIDADAVLAMLTGNADQQTAIDAINNGHIFRFMHKPCPPEVLEKTILACIDQHRLIMAERDLLRNTVSGSIRLLIETISLTDPELGQLSSDVRRDAAQLARILGMKTDWRLPVASSVCLFGFSITGAKCSRENVTEDALAQAASVGSKLLKNIPRLENVADIVARSREHGRLSEDIVTTDEDEQTTNYARLLRFVLDYQLATRLSGTDLNGVLDRMRKSNSTYDPRLLDAASNAFSLADIPNQLRAMRLDVNELRPGMVMHQNLVDSDGSILIPKGHTLSNVHVERLRVFAQSGRVTSTMTVLADPQIHLVARTAA